MPVSDADRARVVELFKSGESYSRVAAVTKTWDRPISKMTLWKIKAEAGLVVGLRPPKKGRSESLGPTGPPPSNPPAPSGNTAGGKRMTGEGSPPASDHDALTRMQWELEQERKQRDEDRSQIKEALKKLDSMSKAPPTFEPHEGFGVIGCPNCGTSKQVPIAAGNGAPQDFDEVLALLDAPHKEAGGKGAKDCPSCGPKLNAKLASMGYAPAAKAAEEEFAH